MWHSKPQREEAENTGTVVDVAQIQERPAAVQELKFRTHPSCEELLSCAILDFASQELRRVSEQRHPIVLMGATILL